MNILLEEDKRKIERIAKWLGWEPDHWSRYHQRSYVGELLHCVKSGKFTGYFPPSEVNGNGMLWLIEQVDDRAGCEFFLEILGHDGSCRLVKTNDLSDDSMEEIEYSYQDASKARDLPLAVIRAVYEAITCRAGMPCNACEETALYDGRDEEDPEFLPKWKCGSCGSAFVAKI